MAGKRRKGIDPLPSARTAPAGAGTLAPERPQPAHAPARQVTKPKLPQLPQLSPRSRWVAAGLAAILVVVVAARVLLGGGSDSATGAELPRQAVLVSIDAADNTALGGALLVGGGQGGTAVLLIPADLLVDVAGFGSVTFAKAGQAPGAGAQAAAVADALRIDVAGTWRVTQDSAAALLQRSGADATALMAAMSADDNTTPEASAAALQPVLKGMVAGLGADTETTLAGLGAGSRTDLAIADLAALLQLAAASEPLPFQTLPLRPLDAGGATPAVTLDRTAAQSLLDGLLAGVARDGAQGDGVRVLVRNGVGTPGLGEGARTKLVSSGLEYVNGGNATGFGYAKSVVLVTPESTEAGAQVASALGLPATAIQQTPQGQTLADVVVVLGADYAP
jgi:hypothetical protein